MTLNKSHKNNLATLFGVMTSLSTAYAIIDFDSLNFHLPTTYIKLLIIGVPAVTGYFSQLK